MRVRGAVITQPGRPFEVVDLELGEPEQGELLVRMVSAGMCHSDDHAATGDLRLRTYPTIGGHEGAGVVEKVGPYTRGFAVGDHVVFSFVATCGRCRWCASGMSNLCDAGSAALGSASHRVHTQDGHPVGQMGLIGAFADHTVVKVESAVRIDKDLPLDAMCLLGCAVSTGWGSAVNQANVRPGETVIVMGIGGIGISAVQGARHAGAASVIAVDPVEFKRAKAVELGATEAFATMDEAWEFARSRTNGQGADSAVVTVGVLKGEHVGEAFRAIRKGGTVVVTAMGNMDDVGLPVSLFELSMYQKRIQGTIFGGCNPHWDIARQVQMYRDGMLKLDEMITTRYRLDEVARGYEDLHAGVNIRGVVTFD